MPVRCADDKQVLWTKYMRKVFMEPNKNKLYIPVNVVESKDIISGIGGKELAALGAAGAVGVIAGIVIYAITANMIYCIISVAFIIATVFIAVRRDNHNESIIDKLMHIYRYSRAQKRFEYEYRGVSSPWEEEKHE